MSLPNILYKNSLIHYVRVGQGKKLVFCFPGFGETAGSFSFLENYTTDYSLVAISLPFHGSTEWNEGLDILTGHIYEIMCRIKQQEGFADIPKFSLLGFSLGGRIVLSLFENYPREIEKLILLAPDGLKVNFWYGLATQTYLGNKLFKFTLEHPQGFLKSVKWLQQARLINAGVSKFVALYLHDEKIRKQLYSVWTGMSRFKPHPAEIKKLVKVHHVPVRMIYGCFDKVISYKTGQKFIRNIDHYCTITILDAGHQLVVPNHAAQIAEAIHY